MSAADVAAFNAPTHHPLALIATAEPQQAQELSDALVNDRRAGPALFAPATSNGAGARLVQRIIENVERAFTSAREGSKRVVVRAGYSAAPAAHTISPPVLLARARSALELSA